MGDVHVPRPYTVEVTPDGLTIGPSGAFVEGDDLFLPRELVVALIPIVKATYLKGEDVPESKR